MITEVGPRCRVGLWELCSKFPSLFYSEFLLKFHHYAHFYSFYASHSIFIPQLVRYRKTAKQSNKFKNSKQSSKTQHIIVLQYVHSYMSITT